MSVPNISEGAVSRSEAPTAPPPFTSEGAPAGLLVTTGLIVLDGAS